MKNCFVKAGITDSLAEYDSINQAELDDMVSLRKNSSLN